MIFVMLNDRSNNHKDGYSGQLLPATYDSCAVIRGPIQIIFSLAKVSNILNISDNHL